MTKQYTRVLALLMVLLTFATVVLTGCKNTEGPPVTTEPEVTTTEAYTEETEPPVQETEPPRTPGVYFVTVLPTANGSVTANCTEAKEGDQITLTVTPDEGYELISLVVNGRHSEETFSMPAEDVFVVARFGYPKDVDWKEYPNGDFFGSAGKFHCSDVLNMTTDSGASPFLLMDADKATPLYAYVKGVTANQFYLKLTAQVTGIRSDENYPKFGLMTNDGAEMVKFYLDMTTDKQVGAVGAVHQSNGGADDWAGQKVWKLNKKLDLTKDAVKLGLLRDGNRYYFYVNGELVATDNNLSSMPTATGIFSFGTSLKLTNYKLVQSGSALSTVIAQAQTDAEAFNAVALTENFFTKTAPGVYTLTTDSDAQHKVDDVTVSGQVMREKYYRVSGKLTLTDAEEWGQARILVSADPQNEYFIALEKLGDGNYQIFTMSKANEEDWNNWELIASAVVNGNRNSIDFEVVVIGDQLYFLIDNEVYYIGSRVSMTESTVKFTGFNVGTTTVENLSTEVFADAAAAEKYVSGKTVKDFSGTSLTENYFTQIADGVYTLTTDSDAQHKVDDVIYNGQTLRQSNYRVSGKLSLTDAEEWGQARILISADPQNEYFIALEKLGDGNYQIFTMSKANEENWNNWELIASGAENGSRNSIDFEVVVIGDQLYFLIDNEIYYTGSRVAMTESTVKFTGYNVGTTTVEKLSAEVFENQDAAQNYLAVKEYHEEEPEIETQPVIKPEGIFFGTAGVHTSSDALDMSTDRGKTPYLVMDAEKATPLYAYIKNQQAKQFYMEATVQVTGIRADEGYPKFGFMTNDGDEMVKFYLDMNTEKQVGTVGAVHQVSGGEDDWAGQKTWHLLKPLDLTAETVKLSLLRDGKNYYFYVNGELEAVGSDLSDKAAAAGIFSFGTSLKLTDYSVTKSGDELDALISKAQEDVKSLSAVNLTTNYFTETAKGVYTLTTDSDAQHKVDDVRIGRNVMRAAYYSIKGNLTLTDAAEWGQARILVSADPQNEYFIALEKLGDGYYQIFTMSKANEEGWNNWELITSGVENGSRSTINFEVIVNADHLYFLIDNEICYESNRVTMSESTVKFTGYNVGTTTVENLAVQIFENSDTTADYVGTKVYRPEPEPTEPETTEPETTLPEIQPEGEFFGTAGDHTSSNVLDMSTDSGDAPYLVMDAELATPLYAYIKNLSEKQFYAEVTVQVAGIRADEGYPKFGFMTNDGDEMVKFYLDMNTEKQVGTVGAVHQISGGADDWTGQKTWQLLNALDLTEDTVKLSLLRDGKNYYFYVNGELEAVGSDLSDEAAAAGVFSFGTSLKLTDYSVIKSGDELDTLLNKAHADVEALSAVNLTTNYFTETEKGVYTLATGSQEEHKVDDVRIGRNVLKEANYSVSGKLSLTDANDWGQARILVSADARSEYFIALEKTGENSYQIFTMSKANEENWNEWKLIESASHNGNRSVLDFELIVIGDQMSFLIEDEICYISDRVSMTESTVKFTGYNVGTTTVENLAMQVFSDSREAEAYAAGKNSRIGENFGVSEGTYFTTEGVSLANDKGDNATVSFVGGAPQYAYLHELHTDKFCFETQVNVTAVLNNDAYPKFGIMVNGSTEMVKFFVDMTPAMTAAHVGVVYQPTGGGDDWAGSVSTAVTGMSFTGSDTVKLKLIRDGRAYYFYVNDSLVLYDENGFAAEKGAVGIFSFNTALTASGYSVLTGADANSAIQSAKDIVAERTKLGLTCNWFKDNGNGVYSLTTNSSAEHKVDDLTRGGNVLQTAYYSVKGKLTLTNAGDWGQARILVSADARNEYFIALERTAAGKYQIFTMSKANQTGWDKWELILHENDNGTRNSIDFEVVVIGNKLYFLIDGSVVYSSTRVSMTESTVKFTGYNVGTTTVKNLSVEVFKSQQEAETYLSEKN